MGVHSAVGFMIEVASFVGTGALLVLNEIVMALITLGVGLTTAFIMIKEMKERAVEKYRREHETSNN